MVLDHNFPCTKNIIETGKMQKKKCLLEPWKTQRPDTNLEQQKQLNRRYLSTNDTEEKLHHQTSPNTPFPPRLEHIFKSQHMKWEKTVATSNLQPFSVARSLDCNTFPVSCKARIAKRLKD
jgi:hypothetical protein